MLLKSKSFLIILLIFGLNLAPYAQNGIIFSEDFESGRLIEDGREVKLSCYRSHQRFNIQSDVTRYGNYAAKLENLPDEGKRCELVYAGKVLDFHYGEENWVGFSFYLPYIAEKGYGILSQHHSVPGYDDDGNLDWSVVSGANGFTLRVNKGDGTDDIPEFKINLIPPENLNYNKNYTVENPNAGGASNGTKTYYSWPAETKKWFDVVLNFRYSDKEDGFFKVWINGELVIDITGSNVILHDTGGRLKGRWYYLTTGIYSGTSGYGAVYYDEVKVGDETSSYEDVAPKIKPLIVPASLTVIDKTANSISLNWEASTENRGVAEYDVFRDGVYTGTVPDTIFTDTMLAPVTTYRYTVLARDIYGNETSQSDTLVATTLRAQTITITPIGDKTTKDPPFDVEATVSSGLPLTYEIMGPATISGETITLDGIPGTVEVTVNQEGDDIYGRTSSKISFEVILITGVDRAIQPVKLFPVPASGILQIKGEFSEDAMARIINLMGKTLLAQKVKNNNQISVADLPDGTYVLIISDKGIVSKAKLLIQK